MATWTSRGNLRGTQGVQGPAGPAGPSGPAGPAGADGGSGYWAGVVPAPGTSLSVIQHDLGTEDVSPTVREVSTGLIVPVAVETVDGTGTPSVNHVRLTFLTPPTVGQYRALITAGAPADLAGAAPHDHNTTEVTGLTSALADKADVGHTHGGSAAPVLLADAATIVTDATLGTHFVLGSMSGDRNLGIPTGGVSGQRVLWEITASAAQRLLTLVTTGTDSFELTTTVVQSLITIPAGKTAFIGAIYSSVRSRWTATAVSVTA